MKLHRNIDNWSKFAAGRYKRVTSDLLFIESKRNEIKNNLDKLVSEFNALQYRDREFMTPWEKDSEEYKKLRDLLGQIHIETDKLDYFNHAVYDAYEKCHEILKNTYEDVSAKPPIVEFPVMVYPQTIRRCGYQFDDPLLLGDNNNVSAQNGVLPTSAHSNIDGENVSANAEPAENDSFRSVAKWYIAVIVGIPLVIGLCVGIDAVIDKIKKVRYENDTSYTLSVDVSIVSKNSVGHEWDMEIIIDGKSYDSFWAEREFVVDKGDSKSVNVKVNAIEYDSIDDFGSTTIEDVKIADGTHRIKEFKVVENDGRYEGNKATLRVECKVEK